MGVFRDLLQTLVEDAKFVHPSGVASVRWVYAVADDAWSVIVFTNDSHAFGFSGPTGEDALRRASEHYASRAHLVREKQRV